MMRLVPPNRNYAIRYLTYVVFTVPFTQAIYVPYYLFILRLTDGQLETALLMSIPLALLTGLLLVPVTTLVIRWHDRALPLGAADENQRTEPMTDTTPTVASSVRGDGGAVSEVVPLLDPPNPL